jgi:hypothetical protein
MSRWIANKWNNIINYVNDAYINKQYREMRKWEKDQMSIKKVCVYIYIHIYMYKIIYYCPLII